MNMALLLSWRRRRRHDHAHVLHRSRRRRPVRFHAWHQLHRAPAPHAVVTGCRCWHLRRRGRRRLAIVAGRGPVPPVGRVARASEQHLLQQVVDLSHAVGLGVIDLFDELPRDRLEAGQGQEDLTETPASLVLFVGNVVLQIYLYVQKLLLKHNNQDLIGVALT